MEVNIKILPKRLNFDQVSNLWWRDEMGTIEGELDLIAKIEHELNRELAEFIKSEIKLKLIESDRTYATVERIGLLRSGIKANRFYYTKISLKDEILEEVLGFFPIVVTKIPFRKEVAFPLFCEYGAMIDSPIPFTILVKQVTLLRPLTCRRAFIPFVEAKDFDHKKIFKEKLYWNELMEKLNQDTELERLLERMSNKIEWSKYVQEIKDDSKDPGQTLGQLLPFKQYTIMIFKNAPKYYEETFSVRIKNLSFPNIKDLFLIFQKLSRYIKEYNSPKAPDGLLPAKWPILYLLIAEYKDKIKQADNQ